MYQHTKLSHLKLVISDERDFVCLGDCLMTNSSLRSLTVTFDRTLSSKKGKTIPIQFSFPLVFGISCHLGLTDLDLSGFPYELDSESLELVLAALSSNTALSLKKVNRLSER